MTDAHLNPSRSGRLRIRPAALCAGSVDFGRPVAVLREGGGRFSVRIDLRSLAVSIMLLLLIAIVGAVSLSSGSFAIPPASVLRALLGGGDENMRMVVVEWRLPRLLLACLLGAALGLSGAIFQSLTRNPLGSPDIIGFSAGSYTGALVVILLFSGGYYATAAGALAGGIGAAACVYLLAHRHGAQGFRLIVVGIGISAMLGAFNAWMIRQADLPAAMSAAIWGAGSLNGLSFEQVLPVLGLLALLAPILAILSRPMRQLELGDDAAMMAGINSTRLRLTLMIAGVALTALATAAAGPIAFISLAAPQIARRVTRAAGVALMPSALTGALLLAAADWLAQHGFGVQLPVGVMTVSVGGFYFLWLLIREAGR